MSSLLGLVIGCAPASRPAPPAPPQYWGGDLTPVVSVKELMRDLLDPLADNLFNAVGSVDSAEGTRTWAPKTDEDWQTLRIGAVAMAEASYLLKVPRPFAPPGDENNSKGPDASELSPAQIKAKLEQDQVLWQAKVEALRNVGKAVLELVDRRDTGPLQDTIEALDAACEGCHLEFWYPRQTELFKKLFPQ